MLLMQDHLSQGSIGNLITLPLQGQALEEGNNEDKLSAEAKWNGFRKCQACDDNVEKFFEGRNELDKYMYKKKLSKEEYLVQLMENYSIDELKASGLRELMIVLETMCSIIYK